MHYNVRKYFHNPESDSYLFLIYKLCEISWQILHISRKERSFSPWKDAAATWRGRRSWRQSTVWRHSRIFNVERNNRNFPLRTRMRLGTLWSPDSREGGGAGGRGRTPGRRWGRTSSAGRARPRSTTSPLMTSHWGEDNPGSQPVNQLLLQVIFLRDWPVRLLLGDLLQKVECRVSAKPPGGRAWREVQVYWGPDRSQGEDQTGGEEEENVPTEAERLSRLWRNITAAA